MPFKFGIDIFDSLETMRIRQRSNFDNFQQFFHQNFRLKWKFGILIVLNRKDLAQIYQNIPYFNLKKY